MKNLIINIIIISISGIGLLLVLFVDTKALFSWIKYKLSNPKIKPFNHVIGIDNGKTTGCYQPTVDNTTTPPPGNETHMRESYINFLENLSEDGLICDLRVSIEDYVDGYIDTLK